MFLTAWARSGEHAEVLADGLVAATEEPAARSYELMLRTQLAITDDPDRADHVSKCQQIVAADDYRGLRGRVELATALCGPLELVDSAITTFDGLGLRWESAEAHVRAARALSAAGFEIEAKRHAIQARSRYQDQGAAEPWLTWVDASLN